MAPSKKLVPWLIGLSALVGACGPSGVQGSSAVANMRVNGTVFTIVLENHGAGVLDEMPYTASLAKQYGSANAYYADHHPSLPNYLLMTSGADHDVTDDDGPTAHRIAGTDNLPDQLDTAKISWRAYMEDMGDPCRMDDVREYAVHHNPFVYYTSFASDTARCQAHDVDMAANFATDLASNAYEFMWITPNKCNDSHDCAPATADQWLQKIIPQIQASDGYKNGGAIFILWDEGGVDGTYVFGGKQTIPFILVSDRMVSPGFVSDTLYDHTSYLATVEDILGLPRLASTKTATPMADFFGAASASGTSSSNGSSSSSNSSSSSSSSSTSSATPG